MTEAALTAATTDETFCGVCKDESGGEYVGIAAVPGAPVSLGWCRSCLNNNAVPRFVVETWLFTEFMDGGMVMPPEPPPLSVFAIWVQGFTVWLDDRYVPFAEAVPILWREEYAAVNE